MGKKIGIGVLTYNRIDHFNLCRRMIFANSDFDFQFEYQDDSFDRKGIAYRTNVLLKQFKDCDHIFIFNDDCFPIKVGWEKVYIESGINHLLYFRENSEIEKIKTENGMDYFNNCGGCMMYLTKEVVEKVGYLNSRYSYYGFEHAGYSLRIHKAGLIPHPYIVPSNAGEYIYAMDFDNYMDFGFDHKPSIDFNEAERSVQRNRQIFIEDIKTIYQPNEDTI